MKKIIYALSAIALLAVSSCTKDNFQQDDDTLVATIDAVSTRTAIAAAGDHYDVNWVTGDTISVSDGTTTALYEAATGGSTVSEFKNVSGSTLSGSSIVGYYPQEISNGFLPYCQKYAADGVYKVPMISDVSSDAKNLLFKPITGILKVNVTTTAGNIVVKSISVRADQGLSGNYTMIDGAAIVNDVTGTALACGEGVAISGTATPFYIAVPANTYTGLKITVEVGDGMVAEAKLQEGTVYTVRRGEIREINIAANTFVKGTGSGVAKLCYGPDFNEFLKQLVVAKQHGNAKDTVITKISFLTNDQTVGTVKVSDVYSEYPVYASLVGTEVRITTPASSLKTGNGPAFMFYALSKLKTIEHLDVIDVSEGEDFSSMFNGCLELEAIDVSNFKTGNSLTFDAMFQDCMKAKTIDVSNFNTGKAISLDAIFKNCESVTELDVKDFDVSNCIIMNSVFEGCHTIKNIDISKWKPEKLIESKMMFKGCQSIEVLHIECLDFTKWTSVANQSAMFNNMPELREVFLGGNCYNSKSSYRPTDLFCVSTEGQGVRTASNAGSLTFHCTQKEVDWLSWTDLQLLYNGITGKTPIPVKFFDSQTGAELFSKIL